VEERRRDIIAATVPLLEEAGFSISTRQIADAAGIAEGTLFRVFSTKEELLHAAVMSYMDPSDVVAKIGEIDPGLPLEAKVSVMMGIVQESGLRVRTFMMAMKGRSLRNMRMGTPMAPPTRHPHPHQHPQFTAQATALRGAIADALAVNEREIVVDLETAATHILTVGLASLILTAVFPNSVNAAPKLAYRALTDHRKETE